MTLDGTMLKESVDPVILGVTFDANMTFEKRLFYFSSAAVQRLEAWYRGLRLGITRKS